ncbi:MAG: peptidoglycan-binding protein [Acidimicrobiia bacterium]|nr:peptidoglycan-binding protein [Acidimicrobiia bacterium]
MQQHVNRPYDHLDEPDQKVAVDGDFGEHTDKALRVAQGTLGITVDGEYGSVTAAAIDRVVGFPDHLRKQCHLNFVYRCQSRVRRSQSDA